jgi:agmatine deiminase
MVFPAEWELHKSTWLAWPDLPHEWLENQAPARQEFLALCKAIRTKGRAPQEKLNIFVKSTQEEVFLREVFKEELKDKGCQFFHFEYGDIWLRDTGCVFSTSALAHVFKFNGWGGKYLLGKDAELSLEMAKLSGRDFHQHNFVFEGGAIDHNGAGLLLTTKQCLLNKNRNPSMTQKDYEQDFEKLGAKAICWISEGLKGDHTDGHVDNILRFVNKDTLICMTPSTSDDPQKEVLEQIHQEAIAWAKQQKLNLLTIKSPGEVLNSQGESMPASYMNFYISNNAVVLPIYGSSQDDQAIKALEEVYKEHKVIALPSNHILTGGGSFHCITQQEPL